MLTARNIIDLLGLVPLAPEGGYYCETYRSGESISESALPRRYGGRRDIGAAIYYLLTPDTFSALHRLATDEVYHFYLGDPVEMLQLLPDGSTKTLRLGHNILENMVLQVVVPRTVWQGARLVAGGRFALLGTTTAPGFDKADYEHGNRDVLIGQYPAARDIITALTRA
jgi:predicted cupin superfamily sugar epimerase